MYRLLIADDEAIERQALRFFIEHSKLEIEEIIECSSGTEAVQIAITKQPDIIVMDIKMPGLTGLEAMERILATGCDCRIIFSTAYSYFDYAIKALQLGAMDFMVKPVKKEKLIGVLNQAIDQLDAARERQNTHIKLDEVMRILGKKILGEIIGGNIDEEALYYLDLIGIGSNTPGRLYFIHPLDPISDDKKRQALATLEEDLGAVGYRCISNIDGQQLVLAVFSPDEPLMARMQQTLETILVSLFRDIRARYEFASDCFEDLSDLERAYAEAYHTLSGTEPAAANIRPVFSQSVSEQLPAEVQAVCDFIDEHYAEKISLDSIAQMTSFSKYHISRLFKQYKNTTIVDYLISVRLARAKDLLLAGDYSIKQISYMIGYSDPNYFTWAFKKQEGVSPVKYRYAQKHQILQGIT